MARGLTPEGAVSPTRPSDYVHCGRRRRAGTAPGRNVWALAAPAIRGGRIQLSGPAWRVHEFAELDYCYGVGPLVLQLDRIEWQRPVPHEGDTWFEVEGLVIDASG